MIIQFKYIPEYKSTFKITTYKTDKEIKYILSKKFDKKKEK